MSMDHMDTGDRFQWAAATRARWILGEWKKGIRDHRMDGMNTVDRFQWAAAMNVRWILGEWKKGV